MEVRDSYFFGNAAAFGGVFAFRNQQGTISVSVANSSFDSNTALHGEIAHAEVPSLSINFTGCTVRGLNAVFLTAAFVDNVTTFRCFCGQLQCDSSPCTRTDRPELVQSENCSICSSDVSCSLKTIKFAANLQFGILYFEHEHEHEHEHEQEHEHER